ncbi:Endoglucanase [Phytophthora megakarya]|uniref:Endoglucanase n=1 Tax=Phytophthora megakarya TaxID=4795 RepID=A0A225WRL2_9STRA|nr:Endoglucanase [Phytophthora megakarya]
MKFHSISKIAILAITTFTTVGAWWKPTPGTSYQIQLNGNLDTTYDVDMYDIDMYDTPNATVTELQQRGTKVVCYFSAGTYEDWRSDKDRYSSDIIGTALPEWAGENWVDIRSTKLRSILTDRMKFAKAKGCDGVDPDNVDGAFNKNGFNLTASDQLDFNKFLATTAHSLNLTVGLKNDLNQIDDLVSYFDFSINEQCVHYDECDLLVPFIKANKPVFGIEYSGNKSTVCAVANSLDFDTLFMNVSLQGGRYSCRDLSGNSSSSTTSGSNDSSSDSSSSRDTSESSSKSGMTALAFVLTLAFMLVFA